MTWAGGGGGGLSRGLGLFGFLFGLLGLLGLSGLLTVEGAQVFGFTGL